MAAFLSQAQEGFFRAGFGFNSPEYHEYREMCRMVEEEAKLELEKAFKTGEGVVVPGAATDASNLRVQMLDDLLREVSFKDKHAVGIKAIGTKQVYSTTFEWTTINGYGGAGDGFTAEDGDDGEGNVSTVDDAFAREVAVMKYMATQRAVTKAALRTRQVENPEKVQAMAGTRELLAKANLALYWGNAGFHSRQFNGIPAQMLSWVNAHPEDQAVLYDAGNQPLGVDLLNDIARVAADFYADPTMLIQSNDSYADTDSLMFPAQRGAFGTTGPMGGTSDTFKSRFSTITRRNDPMLRAGQPLRPDGTGSNGKPRTSLTADAGALNFATTPYTTVPAQADPGSGYFWRNYTLNTDSSAVAAPALPSGAGNQTNHLAAGTYYVAVAPVYNGKEGQAWVYGASAAGTVTGATGVAIAANKLLKVFVAAGSITGLGSTYPRRNTKFRVYIATSAPASFDDFHFLMETGVPTSGNVECYHNGFTKPGTSSAFLLDPDAIALLQLLPLMKSDLPPTALMERFALLWFITPVLFMPRKHIWVRNIASATY